MSFFDWLFRRKKKIYKEVQEEAIQPVELKDAASIKNYVVNLCEQMIDISREMEDVRREYAQVTSYLSDIQIVEGLQGEQKNQLIDVSANVSKLTNVRNAYLNAEHKISDETFNQMQELEDEMPKIIRRFMDNEKYLDTIKRDLNRLAGKKIEWSVQKQEREEEQRQLKKVSVISLFAFGISAVMMAGLSIVMKWSALPMIILAFLATLVCSYIVLRMQECSKDIRQCDLNLNYTITLENRVKIKYVNMKNAVDYTCNRFHVNNSRELTYNYEQFQEACRDREKFKQTNEDLEYFTNRLVRIMRGLNLYDAKIWINYADAVINPKEMVEVKHDLFSRRQNLRERIEYNVKAITDMRTEVDKYMDKMGSDKARVQEILLKVEEFNKGFM